MSALAVLSLLVFYPLLMNLPLNLVRFQWGFKHGLAPMSPDVQREAEAADRMVLYISYFILLAVVVTLLKRSQFSVYAVGLTIANWKSAIALGALASFVFVSMESIIPAEKLREEAESQGPLASWCGLTVLGSVSVELWRVFCIATLVRLDLPSWAAVLAVAIAYGASQLSATIATAAGAATVAAAAGFLFVRTGSLLAPLTMSLIAAGVHLYRARYVSLHMTSELPSSNVTCPVCSSNFNPGKVKRKMTTFTCPECGEQLTYEVGTLFDYVWFALSVFGVPTVIYFLGFRDSTLVFASIGGTILFYVVGMSIHHLFSPPQATQIEGYGGLRLTDKAKRHEAERPNDD
jgi:hypothetical protein